MMRKLILLFFLAVLPLVASADTVEIDGIYYYLDDETGMAYVRPHPDGYTGDIIIPETVSFENAKYIVDNLYQSFKGCVGLKSITIPQSITYIYSGAFENCSSLTSVSIPNSVTEIGDNAFYNCSNLESVTIPEGVTTIGWEVFSGCSSLHSVEIPNSVTSIDYYAFRNCCSLTSLLIPSSVKSIDRTSFNGCSGLTSVNVENGNPIYDSRDGCNAIIETETNTLIAGFKNTTIPNSVTAIGPNAFNDCTSLISIIIPQSVISIPFQLLSWPFTGCIGLESIIVQSGNPNYDSRDNCNAIIETNSNSLIAGCKNTIIPPSVIYIDMGAFWDCTSLTSIKIPNGVRKIGSYAFRNCGITSVTIPESVTSIDLYAFENCVDLATIKVESGNPYYDSREDCNAIIKTSTNELVVGCKKTIIPNSVKAIGSVAFQGCSSLTSITIPKSVTSIGAQAFMGCSGLTSIEIPNSVKSIDDSAFWGCTNLTSIDLPNSLTSIGSFAFIDCHGLTSITIPNGVTNIGRYAISQCDNLTSVTIPNSVIFIGEDNFANCPKLTDIYSMITDVSSVSSEFYAYSNWTLHVPVGCIDNYTAIKPWNNFGSIVEYDFEADLFPDCPAGEIRDAALYLYRKGILYGENGKLYADREASRAEVSKTSFYGAYFGPKNVPEDLTVDNYPSVYSDLQDNTTYYYRPAKALLYLEYGDGVAPFDRNRLAFEPEDKMARVYVLKELLESFNIQPDLEGTDNPFPNDASVINILSKDPRMMGYIRKAADLGIITKANNEFRPYTNCTRGEAFLMLSRIMQKIEAGEIKDPKPQESDYFQPLNTTLKTISLGASLQMGNFQHYTKTSFALNGIVPLAFAHTYNSYNTTLPSVFFGDKSKTEEDDSYLPLGDGWSHNYHSFITVVGDYQNNAADNGLRVIVHWGGGSIDIYKSDGTRLVPESMGIYDEMEYTGGDELTIKSKSQISYTFSKQASSGAAVFYLSSIKDRNGNTLTISYEDGLNGSARIKSVSDGNRSLDFSYLSGTDLLSEVNDPLSRSIKFDYFDNKQTGKKQLKSFTDAEGNTTTYEYADLSNAGSSKLLSRIQLPKGNYIENEYDANMRLKKSESGINGVPTTKTSISVSANYGSSSISTQSQVDVERASGSSSYNYTYNENNVVTGMTGENGLFVNSSYTNAAHPELPTAIQTNNTDVNDISYDEKGNVTSITVSGDGSLTTTMTYDEMNNVTSVTDPKGNKITYSYDGKGNLTGVSAPEGVTANITVDSKGLPTETSNAMGIRTQYQYNEFGNLTKTTLPALGLSSTAVYDAASRLTSATDALGRTSSFVYNNNDFLTSETDAMDHTTKYAYDANDNLTSITNAKGGVTTMSYDNATDWLLSVEFAGAKKQYDYNKDGSLSAFTKPDGTTLSYSYDELGRITSDGINSYSYDNKLRLSEISDGNKSISFSYDGFNRITGTSCDGTYNSYSYDKNGNCTSINDTQYSYDGLNRLTSVSFSGGTISYSYRKDSKLSEVSYPNGMTTIYGYDEVGRPTSKQTKLANGTIVAGYSYVLDKVGNITEQTTQETYNDFVLPNEDTSYSYNDGNRITKAGDISFEFDANGNTTKRGSEGYTWDKKDRLTGAGSMSITYDPLGLIASYGDITFTMDPLGIGNVLSDSKSGAEYIYGNGLEARVINGKASYYVTDVRGSVVAIVDEDGNITHKYQYDEFGKVTQKSEADYNPFQYVGKYGVMALNDHQYYMRARHYDPTIGRFLSEDPIWSTNLYPYADNNPIGRIDPNGTSSVKAFANDLAEFEYLDEALDATANFIYYLGGDCAVNVMQFIGDGRYLGTKYAEEASEYYYLMMEDAAINDNKFDFWINSFGYALTSAWTADSYLETSYTFIEMAQAEKSLRKIDAAYKNTRNIMTDFWGKTNGIGAVDMRTKLGRDIKATYNLAKSAPTVIKESMKNIATFKDGDLKKRLKLLGKD